MKKILAGLALAAAASSAQAAVSITYDSATAPLPAGLTIIENFEGFTPGTPGSSIGPNAFVYNDSVGGQSARPAYNSTGNFGVVQTGGSYTINFSPTSSFSFELGSLDTYNTLTLLLSTGSIVLQGGQIINNVSFPSGDQISGMTNGRVTYTSNGAGIIGATFQSSQNAFEFDDLAVGGAVPEPATWAMLMVGFGAVGAMIRRRRTAVRVTYA